MASVIIDTGVLLVAEKLHSEAGLKCVSNCSERLLAVSGMKNGLRIVLDKKGAILEEYTKSRLTRRSPRGPGALFLVWLLTHKNNPTVCDVVTLSSTAAGTDYTVFPDDIALKDFDQADRKFVASALAHAEKPPISVAIDRGWGLHQEALQAHGVRIEFLCPEDSARLANKRASRQCQQPILRVPLPGGAGAETVAKGNRFHQP